MAELVNDKKDHSHWFSEQSVLVVVLNVRYGPLSGRAFEMFRFKFHFFLLYFLFLLFLTYFILNVSLICVL